MDVDATMLEPGSSLTSKSYRSLANPPCTVSHSGDYPSAALTHLWCSDPPAWKQLISCSLSTQERIPLITSIFSDHNESKVVGYISGGDAQIFVDVVDEVNLDILSPQESGSVNSG